MPYMNGKVDMESYGATTNTVKPVTKEGVASKRKKLAKNKAARPIGSRVQSPDQQEKTMMMGKQPVAVFPRLKGQR